MIKEVQAKAILIKQRRIDSWFLSGYGMNIYRGCSHNCAYCDGRAEKYRVEGEFGETIQAKVNAPELLEKALDPKHKRTPFQNGYILVGGGVGDSYQPAEEQLGITRAVLEVLIHHSFSLHFLTKNCLIERDIDLIKDVNEQSRAIVSMSFSSVDNKISKIMEPGSSLPSEKLKTLARFKEAGIPTGMFLLPVIPFLTDTPDMIDASVKAGKEAGVDFIIFGSMTLKIGRQKDYFMKVLKKAYPQLVEFYDQIYVGDKWGNSKPEYNRQIAANFAKSAKKYGIRRRIPYFLYQDILSENEKIAIMLEHLDYCMKQDGRHSPYGFAAYQILKLDQPIRNIKKFQSIKGVGQFTEKIIKEIIQTGKSAYIESVI